MESSAPAPLLVCPTSLAAAFADIPDPRRSASVRYSLPAILTMAVVAILANQHSVLAISEWAKRQAPDLLATLGFPEGTTPRQSTVHRLFAKLDGRAVGAALTAIVTSADTATTTGLQGIAIDGKAQRGRLSFPYEGCPIHVLSAFCHETGLVLAQEPILASAGTNRAEAELTVAPVLIDRIAWTNRVLTGDALFCQRNLCQQVLEAGGDYLLAVKRNQPQLLADIETLFDPPPAIQALPLTDCRRTELLESGHGRRQERRVLLASTDLVGYLDWPGHAQVMRLERSWQSRGQHYRAVSYAITSLEPDRADPAQLLALKRGHWSIENHLHRCKDVVFGEDASPIHIGQGPHMMTVLRDAAITTLYAAGVRRIASRLRWYSQFPEAAVALVLEPLGTRA